MPLRLEWAVLANARVPYSFTSATRCLREDTTTRLGCVRVIKYGHLYLLTTASGKPDGSGVCQRLPAFLPRPHAFTCRPVPLAARPTPANHVVRVAHKRARRRCGRGVWLHAGAGTGLPRRTGATTARCGVHAVAAARNDLIVGVQRVVEAGAEGHDAQSRTVSSAMSDPATILVSPVGATVVNNPSFRPCLLVLCCEGHPKRRDMVS